MTFEEFMEISDNFEELEEQEKAYRVYIKINYYDALYADGLNGELEYDSSEEVEEIYCYRDELDEEVERLVARFIESWDNRYLVDYSYRIAI